MTEQLKIQTESPMSIVNSKHKRIKHAWSEFTEGHLNKVLNAIKRRKKPRTIKSNFLNARDYMLVKFTAYLGLRPGEATHARDVDIDFSRREYFVNGMFNKCRKDRFQAISPAFIDDLKKYILFKNKYFPSQYLFPSIKHPEKQISVSRFEKMFLSSIRDAGLYRLREVIDEGSFQLPKSEFPVYALRKYKGTKIWKTLGDVKAVALVLGHKDFRSCEPYIYSDTSIKHEIERKLAVSDEKILKKSFSGSPRMRFLTGF